MRANARRDAETWQWAPAPSAAVKRRRSLGAGQTIEEHLRLAGKEKIILGFTHEGLAGDRLGNAALERVVQRSCHVAPGSLHPHRVHAMGERPASRGARAHESGEHVVDLLVALGAQTPLELLAITCRNARELGRAKIVETVVGDAGSQPFLERGRSWSQEATHADPHQRDACGVDMLGLPQRIVDNWTDDVLPVRTKNQALAM